MSRLIKDEGNSFEGVIDQGYSFVGTFNKTKDEVVVHTWCEQGHLYIEYNNGWRYPVYGFTLSGKDEHTFMTGPRPYHIILENKGDTSMMKIETFTV